MLFWKTIPALLVCTGTLLGGTALPDSPGQLALAQTEIQHRIPV